MAKGLAAWVQTHSFLEFLEMLEEEPMAEQPHYLIWSTEHRAWWRGGKAGYCHRLADAGVYPRDEAIKICRQAIPGTAARMGMLPEIPVRVADYEAMVKDLKVLPEHLKR